MFGSFLVFFVGVVFFVITWCFLYFYKSLTLICLFYKYVWILSMLAAERNNTRVIMDFYVQ